MEVYTDKLLDFLQKKAHLHLYFRNPIFMSLALLHDQQLAVMMKTPSTVPFSFLRVQMDLKAVSPL